MGLSVIDSTKPVQCES